MQPDYAKQMEQEQKKYQQSRDPFKLGQQVAQRRYGEIMSGIDKRQAAASQSYSDMYQAAKQAGVKEEASGGPTLSGGLGAQYSDLVSAGEMQQLGEIGKARTQEMLNIDQQRQTAMSDAMLEGQQATQMELQNRQAEFGMAQQKQAIIADKSLNSKQKIEQLKAMGVNTEGLDVEAPKKGWAKLLAGEASPGEAAGTILTTAVAIAGGAYLLKKLPAIGGAIKRLFGGKDPNVLDKVDDVAAKVVGGGGGGGAGAGGGGTPLALPAPAAGAGGGGGGGIPISQFVNPRTGQKFNPNVDYIIDPVTGMPMKNTGTIPDWMQKFLDPDALVQEQAAAQAAGQAAQQAAGQVVPQAVDATFFSQGQQAAGQVVPQVGQVIDAEFTPVDPPSIGTFIQALLQPLGLPAPQMALPAPGAMNFPAPTRFSKPNLRIRPNYYNMASGVNNVIFG